MLTFNHEDIIAITFRNVSRTGTPEALTDPKVIIFEPGIDPLHKSIDAANGRLIQREGDLVSDFPGKYQTAFTLLDSDIPGEWKALLEGYNREGKKVRMVIPFLLVPSAESIYAGTEYLPSDVLDYNTLYTVQIKGIQNTSGTVVVPATVWFTARYKPMCTTYNAVASRLSGFLEAIPENTINFLIWQASKESEIITSKVPICDMDLLKLACSEYALYKTLIALARSVMSTPANMLRAKQLGDLKVTYADATGILQLNMSEWEEEADEWRRVLESGACMPYRGSLGMVTAQKGRCHPDYPEIGRQIREATGSDRNINTKTIVPPRTRHQMAYEHPQVTGIRGNYNWNWD